MMKKFCFILNPKSGKHPADLDAMAACIQINFPGADMRLTKAPGHATELARQAAAQQIDAVVAIGGDGTRNETARGLVGSQTALGVIPRGSGNGFAREIGMPLEFEEAVLRLQRSVSSPCDIGLANKELFLNLAGVGLEAEIAWQFMQHGKNGARGKWPYFKIGAKTIFSYEPPVWQMETDGKSFQTSPLTLVFANGRQYGSNFKIAPQASLCDGLLDMVAVQNAPKWKMALAIPGFFTDTWRPFGLTKTTSVKQVRLTHAGEFPYHIDGEPRQAKNRLEIKIKPHALHILLPEK
ncbi:MAG: diacylglycerol kinase family lipid kinase [Elusimicrobiaceae bacterium]|nr:diacylglycerol kinase family lipid kinase [Elusimicrobiaceae bacterium]